MGMIVDVEEAILAKIAATLGKTVRKVESLPGGWTMDTLTRALQFAPGAYCAFLGGGQGQTERHLDGRFTVYLVAKGASEPARRRGTPRVIGAYDMLERLLPVLDGLDVEDVGRLRAAGVDNLFRDALFDLGGTVYGITLALPNMPFDLPLVEAAGNLDDFLTCHADYDINQDGTVDATDEIDLPQ